VSHQHTVSQEVSLQGIGLHTGARVEAILKPAPTDHGIVFRRVDLNPPVSVEAKPDNVIDTRHAVTLGKEKVGVQTVEHLLAALAGMGIDNCLIELNGPEVPAVDGSARPWVELIQKAQRKRQFAPKTFLKVKERIVVSDGPRFLQLVPSDKLMVFYTMSFGHPFLGEQSVAFNLSRRTFVECIAPARTYVLLQDVERLRAMGLAQGGSLDNTIVIAEDGILNGGLRWRDELVRHKVLDVIGDLYLLGKPLVGTLIAYAAGHELHIRLVQEIQKHLEPKRANSAAPSLIERLVTPLVPGAEMLEKPAT
jgi:UDP-3-O-[3-hydroxymyristoyl] N-acetylglucosamine deacetylase